MFKPKYLISLDRKTFSQDQAVCLGSQLKSIIKNLSKLTPSHIWFGADIDAMSPIPKKLSLNLFQLREIGSDDYLINLCENINQFLSGVFIAVKEKNQNFTYSAICIETEDEPFRSLDIEGVLIEIRAFDTSYFELYLENLILAKQISEIYESKINTQEKIT